MTEKNRDRQGKGDAAVESWNRATLDFWEASANLWFGAMKNILPQSAPSGGGEETAEEDRKGPATEEDLRGAFDRFWEAYFQGLRGAGGEAAHGPSGFLSEGIVKLFEPLWNRLSALSRTAAEGELEGAEEYSKFIDETSRAWLGTYEEELRKYLNMPQLGLTRYYQERFNKTIDRFQVFRSQLTDFARLLYRPVEESLHLMEEEMRAGEEKGEAVLKEPRAWYRAWIPKLEKNYLEMLRSENYIETLRRTLSALYEYRKVRQQFLIDILQDFPIPTNREMDEVYKDLYLIKKRLAKLEKRGDGHEER
ncbi:MAG TPA: poly(R)-hydroxyalkanoic acid synthase subunit PhaE [Syntrophales bacterium]|nr:poly(R)-hydroxyalkanoic acid synthase subunit PhaE [Syntrophales bacterium]HQN76749.1 poly(R)-hydroxyalkanoic acid synthase subunit PhaE [Syntrophales bacterium]HQQ26102.1 poly(R)-hydroxyalkanoic acid synthase subunit PhaE [Syntrophales bacterium]